MKIDKLINKLKTISKSLFNIISESELNKLLNSNYKFPNILLSCKDNNKTLYCKSSKLLITQKKLDIYLDIFAHDIQNPIKSNFIFSKNFINDNINEFLFKQYINEKIYIYTSNIIN